MLSLFPELLYLSPFAAFLIRLAVATVFAYTAYRRLQSNQGLLKIFGVVDAVIALALLAGFSTQLAALGALVCAAAWLFKPEWRPLPTSTVALLLIMTLTLIVTGPGPFAFDLPL